MEYPFLILSKFMIMRHTVKGHMDTKHLKLICGDECLPHSLPRGAEFRSCLHKKTHERIIFPLPSEYGREEENVQAEETKRDKNSEWWSTKWVGPQ
ncbi:hypothetical protein NPIL_487121 [Nephila pilipes]|uniref:Uncharacterized protein n=1 Tax=Nephila pilipes TaxID=299642 RepID=A0A8X6N6E7_NEPPI|nr:hypothetical protein NPIL_487121 [Nephila pilipes]